MTEEERIKAGPIIARVTFLSNLVGEAKSEHPLFPQLMEALYEASILLLDMYERSAVEAANNQTTRFVAVIGCDDTTTIKVKATPAQWELIEWLAAVVTANGGGCAPTMDANYHYLVPDAGAPDLDLTSSGVVSPDGGDS